MTSNLINYNAPKIGPNDGESQIEWETRMMEEKGYIPTLRRVPKERSIEEQVAWNEENQMDAKRKVLETQLRTEQSCFAKKRKFQTITNLSTAIKDLDTAVDGRLLKMSFPEAPVDFVGYAGCHMAACRQEPGHTLIREYVDANTRPNIVDVLGQVKLQVQEVVRDLFNEKPKQAETRLVKFFHETCLGDYHDAKPFIHHLEPFDLQRSTLACMLDSIYQQGKGQAAQLTELRNQNIEHRQQFKRQAEQLNQQAVQIEKHGEDTLHQHERLNLQLEKQKDQLQQQLREQNDKLDQLLLHVPKSIPNEQGHLFQDEPSPLILPTHSDQCEAQIILLQSEHYDAQRVLSRSDQRHAQRVLLHLTLKEQFIIGQANGASIDDQLTPEDARQRLQEHTLSLSSVAIGKALISLGAKKKRIRVESEWAYVYQHIKYA
jgi:hypothetical protein